MTIRYSAGVGGMGVQLVGRQVSGVGGSTVVAWLAAAAATGLHQHFSMGISALLGAYGELVTVRAGEIKALKVQWRSKAMSSGDHIGPECYASASQWPASAKRETLARPIRRGRRAERALFGIG